MDETEKPGPAENARQLCAGLLAVLGNRLELLMVELQEDRLRMLEALLLIAAIAVAGCLTLALAVAAVIVLTWTIFGVKGLFVLSGAGLVATFLLYWCLRARLKTWTLLSGTLAELKKDRECLESK